MNRGKGQYVIMGELRYDGSLRVQPLLDLVLAFGFLNYVTYTLLCSPTALLASATTEGYCPDAERLRSTDRSPPRGHYELLAADCALSDELSRLSSCITA